MKTMTIIPSAGLNADGFSIIIDSDNGILTNKTFTYGYSASYDKRFASDKAPYVTDILEEMSEGVDSILVMAGRNVFAGKPIRKETVDNFVEKYIKGSRLEPLCHVEE